MVYKIKLLKREYMYIPIAAKFNIIYHFYLNLDWFFNFNYIIWQNHQKFWKLALKCKMITYSWMFLLNPIKKRRISSLKERTFEKNVFKVCSSLSTLTFKPARWQKMHYLNLSIISIKGIKGLLDCYKTWYILFFILSRNLWNSLGTLKKNYYLKNCCHWHKNIKTTTKNSTYENHRYRFFGAIKYWH